MNNNWTFLTDVNDTTAKYGVGIYNNDDTLVGNISLPFLLRGGNWDNGIGAGVFTSLGDYGFDNNYERFSPGASCTLRVVL